MKTSTCLLILSLLLPVIVWADETPAEIEYLLTTMSTSDCTFIRNGKEYDAADAESHLRKCRQCSPVMEVIRLATRDRVRT